MTFYDWWYRDCATCYLCGHKIANSLLVRFDDEGVAHSDCATNNKIAQIYARGNISSETK
jgi:hypothetical protein